MIFSKVLSIIHLIIMSSVLLTTSIYLSYGNDIDSILADMAALAVLTEFNNYMGNFMQILVHKNMPHVEKSDFMNDKIQRISI